MQNIKKIIKQPDYFKNLVKDKGLDLDIDLLISIYKKRSDLLKEVEKIRQRRNENVEEIKKIKGKPPKELIVKGRKIKAELGEVEEEMAVVEEQYQNLMWKTPQIVSEDTPVGKDDSENVERWRWSPETGKGGDPKKFDFKFKDHIELGESLNLLDLEKGVQTSGFRGYYLKNEAVLMHMGLMMYGLKFIQSKGFQTFVPPTIVRDEALWGSGHFPFDEENIYMVDSLKHFEEADEVEGKEKKYLIGTAEPSILNYSRDEVFEEEDLPRKYAGFSQCYRSEVGSYGKDTKGIYRIHEFMKIEQVVICDGKYDVSEEWHKKMLGYSEELLQKLELPYRVIQVCTGDMGAGKYKMYDIETWMPSRDSYGETHSASNLGDWQARRLNIKVKGKDGKKYYAHALNNTVIASPRILIAIWENYQNPDGSITVPEVLREFVGKDIIEPR
ncbi:serine--tRNA ligase [Candidatus Dojkabacteria bacterium]|nr:serine--tRNA ligase [Candidatus Dojkabacteria bacterium]